MTIEMAELLVTILGAYVGLGFVFALCFLIFGAAHFDPAAKGMPVQARLIILPGMALLWPLMLVKVLTQKEPPLS